MQQTAITKTLSYFSIFNFPLTAPELFSNLWQGTNQSFYDFLNELERLVGLGIISKKCSYYFLPGQVSTVEERRRAVPYVDEKLKRAYRAARLIAGVPFLKAIFVCNSVAAEAADEGSDIDFFIIAHTGRAWLVRIFTNIIIFIFGLRRHGKKVANRICLSFYIDEAHLDLAPLAIAPDDIYLAYWLKQLVPLYDPEKIYNKLLDANKWQKQWINTSLLQPFPAINISVFGKFIKNLFEWCVDGQVGNYLEKVVRTLQQRKIAHTSVGKQRTVASAVVTTDGVLKFHETDARERIRQEWLQNCKKSYVV